MSAASLKIAQTILEGFKTHYRLFQSSTNEALELFTEKKWKDLQNLSKSRISFYDNRVAETFKTIQSQYNAGELESLKWGQIKKDYVGLLLDLEQPELAETFFDLLTIVGIPGGISTNVTAPVDLVGSSKTLIESIIFGFIVGFLPFHNVNCNESFSGYLRNNLISIPCSFSFKLNA